MNIEINLKRQRMDQNAQNFKRIKEEESIE